MDLFNSADVEIQLFFWWPVSKMQIFHVANIWSHSSYIHILLHVYTAVLDLKVVTDFLMLRLHLAGFIAIVILFAASYLYSRALS